MTRQRTPHPTRPVVGPAEEPILRAVLRYPYMTAEQVTKLLYSWPGSLAYAQRKLKALTDADHLQRIYLPRKSRSGSAPSVYTLSRRGMRHLEATGAEVPQRARPSVVRELTYLFLSHVLAVNDVLIATELLARLDHRVQLVQTLHELDLKRQPIYVTDTETGRQQAVIPDGYAQLIARTADGRRHRFGFSFEVDRGTEHRPAWQRKVRGIVAFADGPYLETFGTDALTVCVLATPGQKRARDLLSWTQDVLVAMGRSEMADLFRITPAADLAALTPGQLFTTRRWAVPFGQELVALLTLDPESMAISGP